MDERNGDVYNEHKLLDRMVTILEDMSNTTDHCTAEYECLQRFLQNSPPKFEGGPNPDGAYRWLQEIEKIFRTLQCSNAQKIVLAPHMLVGEAENWWDYFRSQMEEEAEGITWEVFRKKFLEKFFPEDARQKKENEFLELKQGSMSVNEYAAKFEELSKFSRYYQTLDERAKCIRFENGLKLELRPGICLLEISHLPTLVNKSRVYEENKLALEKHQKHQGPQTSIKPHKCSGNTLQIDKKSPRLQVSNQKSSNAQNQSSYCKETKNSQKQSLRGQPYRKPHGGNRYPDKGIICSKCRQTGHQKSECPTRGKVNRQ